MIELRQQLTRIEQQLQQMGQWQSIAPLAAALASNQPFCLDTLTPYQWLQWVLLPRLSALLDAKQLPPKAFAIAPYFEVSLAPLSLADQQLIKQLQQLDEWVAQIHRLSAGSGIS